MSRAGGCLCGAVRYAAEGEPLNSAHCHCTMCQRASGAGFLTWTSFPKDAVRYTRGMPKIYRSSEYGQREFCGACGSQLVFRGLRDATVDVTSATLDEPDLITPQANTWAGTRRAWLHGFDPGLPDLPGEWPGEET